MKKLIFTCGTGGVGKTTSSALLGIAWAYAGYRSILVTIDPARRLADSLHIELEGNQISTVPLPNCSGSLDAMMLDASNVFNSFAKEHSSKEAYQNLQKNRYFQFARDRMGGIQEYMAIVQMMNLVQCNEYDVIIIDTPPARNAIEFLEAPLRMSKLFSNRVMHWLSSRTGFDAFSLGKSVVSKGLRLFLGDNIITDMTEFFSLFQTIAEELNQVSVSALETMKGERTEFWLVSTPQQNKALELKEFIRYLRAEQFPLTGVIWNKYPSALSPLSDEQQQFLSTHPEFNPILSEIDAQLSFLQHLVSEQMHELELQDVQHIHIPKTKLHHINDMVQLAQTIQL